MQKHCFANKGPYSQSYSFSSSHVWMWELEYKVSWALKNGCFWTVVLEKTLASPLDCKEIQPVHPKGDQSWVFTGRTDAEAETPLLWPPNVKEELTRWKRPWCWERLKAGGEGDDRGWDGWIASPTQWTWVWVISGNWWWTEAWSAAVMGLQRVGRDWVTELNWTEYHYDPYRKKKQKTPQILLHCQSEFFILDTQVNIHICRLRLITWKIFPTSFWIWYAQFF